MWCVSWKLFALPGKDRSLQANHGGADPPQFKAKQTPSHRLITRHQTTPRVLQRGLEDHQVVHPAVPLQEANPLRGADVGERLVERWAWFSAPFCLKLGNAPAMIFRAAPVSLQTVGEIA